MATYRLAKVTPKFIFWSSEGLPIQQMIHHLAGFIASSWRVDVQFGVVSGTNRHPQFKNMGQIVTAAAIARPMRTIP